MSTPPSNPTGPRPGRTPLERPGPAGGKRDENRQKRTRALCEASLRLFLAHGIELVTIDDIVNEAGVAKGSFYRYFEDKADLVAALLVPLSERMRHAFASCETALATAGPGESLSQPYTLLAGDLLTLLMQDADVARLYLQECRAPAVGARKPIGELAMYMMDRATNLSATAARHGLTRKTDSRLTALAVVGAVEHLVFRFLAGDQLGATEEIPGTLISLILDGLRAPATPTGR